MPTKRLRVLFLCTGNSCRSQMAEAWTKKLKGGVIDAYSAGTFPKPVDRRAIKVMAEAGVDMSSARSKSVDRFLEAQFDCVVTVCDQANETCPVFLGKTRRIHAGFDDPPRLALNAKTEEKALVHYRRIRDEIKAFVEKMPDVILNNTG